MRSVYIASMAFVMPVLTQYTMHIYNAFVIAYKHMHTYILFIYLPILKYAHLSKLGQVCGIFCDSPIVSKIKVLFVHWNSNRSSKK